MRIIKAGNPIDGTEKPIAPGMSMVIEDQHTTRIVPSSGIPIPESVGVIDGIPSLVRIKQELRLRSALIRGFGFTMVKTRLRKSHSSGF